MSLANPWAFYFLAITIPIVAMYLLRVRRRRQLVPSLALWQRIFKESRATALFQRLKRLLSLLLQIIILMLLVFALSRPFTGKGFLEKKNIVMILDASASMTVAEGKGETRFSMAIDAAKRIVRDRGVTDEMMIIRASTPAEVIQPFTQNTKALLHALDEAKVGRAPASLEESVKLAREILADRPGRRIIIISDGSAGKVKELAEAKDVDYVSVGEATENVGFVAFRARKNTSVMTDFVFTRVKNFGTEAKNIRLELGVNNVAKQVIPMTLEPGQERAHHFTPLAYPGGALLTLSISRDDGGNWSDAFPDDDVAYAVVPPFEKKKVILVTSAEQDFFFSKAFSAMPESIDDETSFVTTKEKYAELSEEDREADLTIFDGCEPELPERGNFVIINSPVSVKPFEVIGNDTNVSIRDWNRKHPVTRFLSFHHLIIRRTQKLRLTGEGEVLLEGNSGPLIAVAQDGQRRIVYLGFDILDTDLPFKVAFPALLRNVLTYFHQEEHNFVRTHYTVGEIMRPLRRLPENAAEAGIDVISTKDSKRHVLDVANRTFLFADTTMPGFYKLSFTGQSFYTVVNLLTPESDIKPLPGTAKIEALSKSALFLNRDFWIMFALIGALVLSAEWLLFQKRITE